MLKNGGKIGHRRTGTINEFIRAYRAFYVKTITRKTHLLHDLRYWLKLKITYLVFQMKVKKTV
jgi:hypothetical protein